MIKPEKHKHEEERLKSLESYCILDTLPEADFDNLAILAAEICDTPISLVTFIDEKRQWYKSRVGIEAYEIDRDYTFCGHAINLSNDIFIVPDSREDERFFDNPAVTGELKVVFYAGVPLVTEKGLPIGTLCVVDQKPRELTQNQIKSLKALSDQTMKLLELRLNKIELEKTLGKLEGKNVELEKFAHIAAHDLKSPLANISGLTEFFVENYGIDIDADGQEILNLIKTSSAKLREMIDGLLEYSKSDQNLKNSRTEVNLQVLKEELSNLFTFKNNCLISVQSNVSSILTNKTAIEQILINLVANAIKYNDKEIVEVQIEVIEEEAFYSVSVKDNGIGISKEHFDRIFQIFEVLSTKDRFGENGNGIGLATVKKIVETLKGTIAVESEIGKGSKFMFTISRF
ncbi:GAF sensor signal transduction histidine kinase [Flavobacterium fluvii]|uniref:histidine kinase n=1 Tax=Flavobacterium fluvii TaxID=468056 RepID=A0A1M5NTS1_9FLAO|nr:ATP-binding protein [Flavobacterium fluvii]SHG92579.1 GAF sensor signal transduction histidine kinase [Flavobacterium fluvii]